MYACRSYRLHISTTPAAPTLIASSPVIANLVSTIGFEKHGNYLYVASISNRLLQIVDVTNPLAPVAAGSVSAGATMNRLWGIRVSADGNYVYGVSEISGASSNKCFLIVFNVTNKASPTVASTYNITDNAHNDYWCTELFLQGTTAYVGVGNALVSLNISNPAAVTYRHKVTSNNIFGAQSMDVSADGTRLFFASRNNRYFNVVNIANPDALVYVTGVQDNTRFFDAYYTVRSGNYVFVSSESSDLVTAINISNPASPTFVDTFTSSTHLNGANGIAIKGRYMYVAGYFGSNLTVLDLQCDPSAAGSSLGACSGGPAIDYFSNPGALGFCNGTNWLRISE